MWAALIAAVAVFGAWAVKRGAGGGLVSAIVRPKPPHVQLDQEVKERVARWRVECERAANRLPFVSPELLLGVIARESRGDEYARGDAGEVGLMQVRKGAWQDYQAATNDPETLPFPLGIMAGVLNIRVGSWYLNHMIEQAGNEYDGLRAYNCGLTGSRENPSCGGDYADYAMGASREFFA